MTLARVGRWIAVLIVIAGVIDPAISQAHSARPVVTLLHTSGPDAVADAVASSLGKSADVVRGLTPSASAVVVVGDRLPEHADAVRVPAFAVLPPGPAIAIDNLSAPSRAHLDARVPVAADLHVRGAKGGTLSVSLTANGLTLDHVDRPIASDDARVVAPLTFVPSAAGAATLRVTASIGTSTTSADVLTTVDARPWNVLVFDRRPSWMSTFVRRAMEDDERFAVTSRTLTSKDVATDTPNAPADLSSLAGLERFDAIVVGAPDALTGADVTGLSNFMRRRGGAVVLLWDVRPAGPALALTTVDRWSADTRANDRPIPLAGGTIRASDTSWPTRLPDRAFTIGSISDANTTAGSSAAGSPVVWGIPVGAGRLVVSGALDSWRFRALTQTAFDGAWRRVIAEAADAAPEPVTVTVSPSVVKPGQHVSIAAVARDAALAPSNPPSSMQIALGGTGSTDRTPVRAWPGDRSGRFTAETEAPTTPGVYQVDGSDGTSSGSATLVVKTDADAPQGGETDRLAAWASAHGGRVTTADEVASAIPPARPSDSTPEPWHPMRSGWWILPITLLTGIEWWTRRRQGLR